MIEIGTIFLLLVLSNLIIAFLLIAFYFLFSNENFKSGLYIISKFLQSAAWLFILIRPEIPLLWSVVLGNAFLFVGLAFEVCVLVNANRKEPAVKELFLLLGAGVAFLLGMMFFYGIVHVRYALHSFCLSFYVLFVTIRFLFSKERTKMQVVTAIMTLVVGVMFINKGLNHLAGKDDNDIFEPNRIRNITTTLFLLLSYLWPIMFLFIRYEYQKMKLATLYAARDKIFSIISHDLRSPYHAILGFSEIVVEDCKRKEYSSVEKNSTLVLNAAKQSYHLLNNLLEWLHIQTGRIAFNPETITLEPIVTTLKELYKANLEDKGIQFVAECDSEISVRADVFMIETVLRNLIGNAIKFTNQGGQVKVVVSKVDNGIKISIADSGIGISDEDKDKILNSEISFTTRGTNNEKGSGLGLFICKGFIEKHKSKLQIEGEHGKGSVFWFVLPTSKV